MLSKLLSFATVSAVLIFSASDAFAQRALRGTNVILDDNGVGATYNTINITPPAVGALTANYTLTLPTGVPGTGNTGLLLSNATGTLNWLNSATAQNGYSLQVVAGAPTWVSPSANTSLWSTTGNTGLTAGTNNFLGTLDATTVNVITGGTANIRMTIDGTTGLVSINNGLLVSGATPADNTLTLGASATAGLLTISDGTANLATIQTTAHAANHTYNLPNIGAAATAAEITTATGQGTAGQALVSQGANAPAVWTTSPASTLVRGKELVVNGQITYTIVPGPAVTATSTVIVAFETEVGGQVIVSAVTPGAAGVGSFTVTLPAPADDDNVAPDDIAIHWTFIP